MNYKFTFAICLLFVLTNMASAQRKSLGKRSIQETLKLQKTVIKEKKQGIETSRNNVSDGTIEEKQYENIDSHDVLPITQSDIDINIPQTTNVKDSTFVVIIANENYTEVDKVPYALRDGELFKAYCIQALGIPEKNVHYVADATLNNMKKQIRWLSEIIEIYEGEAKVIFYYSGHGIPDEKNFDAYLLPIDGYGSDIETGYALNDLYKDLGENRTESVVLFLDACFSGSKRGQGMLASARGVAIKAKESKPIGNMIVFSAAQEDETALPYEEQGHGMFTYFLLKKIQEKGDGVKLGELGEYVVSEVKKRSVVINQKMQTPSITSSANLLEKWKNVQL